MSKSCRASNFSILAEITVTVVDLGEQKAIQGNLEWWEMLCYVSVDDESVLPITKQQR